MRVCLRRHCCCSSGSRHHCSTGARLGEPGSAGWQSGQLWDGSLSSPVRCGRGGGRIHGFDSQRSFLRGASLDQRQTADLHSGNHSCLLFQTVLPKLLPGGWTDSQLCRGAAEVKVSVWTTCTTVLYYGYSAGPGLQDSGTQMLSLQIHKHRTCRPSGVSYLRLQACAPALIHEKSHNSHGFICFFQP